MKNARLISSSQYMTLDNPEFVGQTRVNCQGEYRMYWKVGNKTYYTCNNINC
jgi:hypothetical protein